MISGAGMGYAAQAESQKWDVAAAQREPEIPGEMQRLEKTISELEQTVGMLLAKLGPVMRSEPPQTGAKAAPEQVLGSGLANALAGQRSRIVGIAGQVARAMGVVEL